MSFKETFKHYWILMVTVLVLSFWLGFFACENIYNQNTTYYSIGFKTEEFDSSIIDANFFLDALKKVDKDGNISYSYATVNPKAFFENEDIDIVEEKGILSLTVKAKYFIGSDESTISEKSQERFFKVIKKVVSFHDPNATINNINIKEYSDYSFVQTSNYINPYIVSIITLAIGLFVYLVVMFLIRKKLITPDLRIYDSGKIFKTPFSKKYWDKAINSLRKMKIFDMCLIAILFALQLLMKSVSIPSGFANLELGVTYLIFSYICLIYGPIWGLVIGFSSDIFGFIMKPTIFHPGYTLQAMLTGFVYGLFLYRTDLKFSKVLLCRIVVNILLNGIFGAFLWGSYADLNFDATITYMIVISLPKNIIYLIPQTVLLYLFLKLSVPLLVKKNIVPLETISTKEDFA